MTLSEEKPSHSGLAGRLAGTFVNSKLTVLFVLASLLLGVFAAVTTAPGRRTSNQCSHV
jgi:hypothetical protein